MHYKCRLHGVSWSSKFDRNFGPLCLCIVGGSVRKKCQHTASIFRLFLTISGLHGSFGRFSTWSWQFISIIASFPTSSSVNVLQFFCKLMMTRWLQISRAPFGAFIASKPCFMNSSFSLGSSNSTCGSFLRSVSMLMSRNIEISSLDLFSSQFSYL